MSNIADQISRLSTEKQQEFRALLLGSLYDRDWCELHGVNYAHPNVASVKAKLYQESFAPKVH
ncbi:MAG: hypothetical protein Q7S06_02670 [Nanoarchaeota archaeon]|nr:hypothetical protein [Nanoarchaeota archaeon]